MNLSLRHGAAAAALFATGVLLAPGAARAGSYTFATINNPADVTFNQLLGINNGGTIAGYFGSGAAGHPNQGYTVASPYASYTAENFPGSVQTQVTGLNNNGTTVGFWSTSNLGVGLDPNFGFVHQGSTFTSVNDPLGAGSPAVNQLLGINDNNIAVGFYNDAANTAHAYAYAIAAATFTPITVASATATTATGINDNSLVSGFFTNGAGNTLGFLENLNGTGLTTFEAPGSTNTMFLGVNGSGEAVGVYTDAAGLTHGLTFSAGVFTSIDDPFGIGTTTINGVNDHGQLVGFYTDGQGNVDGLLADPVPEPPAMGMLAVAVLLLGALRGVLRHLRA